jgi:hypothetical protein
MSKYRSNNFISRIVVLVATLLVSNILMLTCALAMEANSDCPDAAPIHCIDMCDMSDAVSSDKFPEGTADPKQPFAQTVLLSTIDTAALFATSRNTTLDTDCRYHSPPINLLNCVFLK